MSGHIIEFLTNAYDPDVRVYKEAVYLVRRGFSVTILCWDRTPEKEYPAHEVKEGIVYSCVPRDLAKFKGEADIIIANRFTPELADVLDKVCTRDPYFRD